METILYENDAFTIHVRSIIDKSSSTGTHEITFGKFISLLTTTQSNRKLDLTGEMIFGTAPLAYKGMNTKVHYYKRDKHPQIIVSKLFTLHNHQSQQQRDLDITRRTSFSSINSERSVASFTANSSLCEDNVSEQSSDDDHFSAGSIYPPVLGLYRSTKRTRRFSQTNMENGTFNPTPLPTTRISPSDNVSAPIPKWDLETITHVFIACTTNFTIRQICRCIYHHTGR